MEYRVIKENNTFLLTNFAGDIVLNQKPSQGFGLYNGDTRFISCLELRINAQELIVLSSEADQNYISTIVLTNPHMETNGIVELWRESIEVKRIRFISNDVLYETITASNFSPYPNKFDLSMLVDADFTDMFVVRGFMGGKLGSKPVRETSASQLCFTYLGTDGVERKLRADWSRAADQIGADGSITFKFQLAAGESQSIKCRYVPITDGVEPLIAEADAALAALQQSYGDWTAQSTSVDTDSAIFNALYDRGSQDIRVLLTDIGHGSFPVAGLPWFAVPFGRDSLIAALQLLPFHPQAAKGTLLTMAHYQGDKLDPWRDEQPGKIMHELRTGELSRTNQVPFSPYYGSVDATPLFLLLLAEYFKWTGDVETFNRLRPNMLLALDWIAQYGQRDGSPFVSYFLQSSKGIANQGWKDSADSIIHRSGEYAQAPIALVEVQGYVYQAKSTLAALMAHMPDDRDFSYRPLADRLSAEAEELRQHFEAEFWIEEQKTYAIALDHQGNQVQSVTSNPGHVLMSGICDPARAKAVADLLVSPRMFSGYGIRTMAEGERGYNPMSYHDGSVWPHDNSLCLIGLSANGFAEQAITVMEGLLLAAGNMENNRLPELFCGYSSLAGKPVRYPVACSPQAWAAAAPLAFLYTLLGIKLDYPNRSVAIAPAFPSGMNRLSLRAMRLADSYVDLDVNRTTDGYEVKVLHCPSGWQIEQQRRDANNDRQLNTFNAPQLNQTVT